MANPWPKGTSGNPRGRPKKADSFTEILKTVLKEKTVKWKDKNGKEKLISGKEAAARKLTELAVRGDVGALKYIGDRIDGKPAPNESQKGPDNSQATADENRARYDALFGAYGGKE